MVPKPLQPFLLSTYRCMELVAAEVPPPAQPDNKGQAPAALDLDQPVAKTRLEVRIRHFDRNRGPLALVIQPLFQGAIERGFRQMTADLAARMAGR